MGRYFTKSLHKKAQECPTKLYYQARPDEYENKNLDDAFLLALAKGGFQVGELAKIYYPGGIEISSLRSEEALNETARYLQEENVVLYEPAIQFEDFLVRVDILVKKGNKVSLFEVKAKSFNPDEDGFYNKVLLKKQQYQLLQKWQPYLYDIAFQSMVCRGSRPDLTFIPHMVFVDKSQTTSVAGLNQRFLIGEENGRTRITVAPGTDLKTVGQKILCTVPVGDDVERIINGEDQGAKTRAQLKMPSFYEEAKQWAKAYLQGIKLAPALSKDCRSCEFKSKGAKKSGFNECWEGKLKRVPAKGELIIDLWNYRKTDDLIAEGRLLLSDLTQDDLKLDDDGESGMSVGQRQWIQAEKNRTGNTTPAVDEPYLHTAIGAWKYPLHCIDFETTMVAVPFHAGRRPYEQVAFQFSHHIIHENGDVSHAGEYLHCKRGSFPNFDFLRALKKQLENDQGSIFRYSNHENTVLCQIHEQLQASQEADKEELMSFIRSITKSKSEGWEGERNMIDLWEIVKKAYFHPLTNGSNSIKYVLPAILFESKFLKGKYGAPVYGAKGGIASSNFRDYVWLQHDDKGAIIDPYKQLPPIFEGIDDEVIDSFLTDGDELAEGGAAMMAFAKMQFTEMSELEFQRLNQALLRYCELDTLAMVMLIEHFLEISGKLQVQKAV